MRWLSKYVCKNKSSYSHILLPYPTHKNSSLLVLIFLMLLYHPQKNGLHLVHSRADIIKILQRGVSAHHRVIIENDNVSRGKKSLCTKSLFRTLSLTRTMHTTTHMKQTYIYTLQLWSKRHLWIYMYIGERKIHSHSLWVKKNYIMHGEKVTKWKWHLHWNVEKMMIISFTWGSSEQKDQEELFFHISSYTTVHKKTLWFFIFRQLCMSLLDTILMPRWRKEGKKRNSIETLITKSSFSSMCSMNPKHFLEYHRSCNSRHVKGLHISNRRQG